MRTDTAHSLSFAPSAPFQPLRRWLSALRAVDDRLRLANQLDALDDYMLSDIGITRSHALREARRLRQL